VGSNHVSSKILDGSGVKAMPGSISAPNSGSLMKNKKNPGSQMGHTHKKSLQRCKQRCPTKRHSLTTVVASVTILLLLFWTAYLKLENQVLSGIV